jgi:hypothetical protein
MQREWWMSGSHAKGGRKCVEEKESRCVRKSRVTRSGSLRYCGSGKNLTPFLSRFLHLRWP